MTDAEISRRLALAIGYKPKQIRIEKRNVLVWNKQTIPGFEFIGWHKFDYFDPTVIWPIAERFDCFPSMWEGEGAKAWDVWIDADERFVYAETAAKAVALAVIKLHREEMKDALNKCVLKPVITGTEEAK